MILFAPDAIQWWLARWFEKRPNLVRDFYISGLLEDFQKELKERNDASEKGKRQSDNPVQHRGDDPGGPLPGAG
jgi:hypothetical protein